MTKSASVRLVLEVHILVFSSCATVILDLAKNSFSGTLSSHFLTMTNLQQLSFSENELGGNLMDIIRGFRDLRKWLHSEIVLQRVALVTHESGNRYIARNVE